MITSNTWTFDWSYADDNSRSVTKVESAVCNPAKGTLRLTLVGQDRAMWEVIFRRNATLGWVGEGRDPKTGWRADFSEVQIELEEGTANGEGNFVEAYVGQESQIGTFEFTTDVELRGQGAAQLPHDMNGPRPAPPIPPPPPLPRPPSAAARETVAQARVLALPWGDSRLEAGRGRAPGSPILTPAVEPSAPVVRRPQVREIPPRVEKERKQKNRTVDAGRGRAAEQPTSPNPSSGSPRPAVTRSQSLGIPANIEKERLYPGRSEGAATKAPKDTITHQQTRGLLLEHLKQNPTGTFEEAWKAVVGLACGKGLISGNHPPQGSSDSAFRLSVVGPISGNVRQILEGFQAQGILRFGLNHLIPNWPYYRLTEYGRLVVGGHTPQPDNPNRILDEFKRTVQSADSVVYEHIEEAVHALNQGCPKSAAVMLAAASEKTILLLHEAFANAITNPDKRKKFDKDSNKKRSTIAYAVLKDRLDLMVVAKTLTGEKADTVSSVLPAGFELLRRFRNAAGHPESPGVVDPDLVRLDLRMFAQYARRVFVLIAHFGGTPANW